MSEFICFKDDAFFQLVEIVVQRLEGKLNAKAKKWLTGDEVMAILNIKSKTTLQDLRDKGKIKFSQPEKKIILYDADSVEEYLNENVRKTF